ncbi:MAG: hypothetical protein QMD61_00855 [Methanobacterium sp.]|nr:hypothetical protein [Methanobacterium sp.]
MDLEELNNKKKDLLGQINAYEELQSGLEYIERYNRENYTNEKLKVYTTAYEPHLEEITESNVADILKRLTDNLLKVSEEINHIKMSSK